MKAVILAGGLGTRLSEETHTKPKPMIEIGGKPILWHIMKIYSHYGVNDFVICLGYKGYIIKEYFINYFMHLSDLTIDLKKNETVIHQKRAEPWSISLVDTGEETMTGGRLKRVKDFVADEEHFCFTYGDGVADINIHELMNHHKTHGSIATVTAVQPPGRFGVLSIDSGKVAEFKEKPEDEMGWINGGFFILSPKVFDYIDNDSTIWEKEPLERLADEGKLSAYHHKGFWKPMDTLRDKKQLEDYWASNMAPWKTWTD